MASAGAKDLTVILCQRVDERSSGWELVSPNEIIYAFLESELAAGHIVEAEWKAKVRVVPGVVYVRTAKGVYRTRLAHLTELEPYLSSCQFVDVNRSLVAQFDAVKNLDMPFQVGVRVRNSTEFLRASQRNFDTLLARLGLTRRDLSR